MSESQTKRSDEFSQRYILVAFKEEEPDRHCVLEGGVCTIGRTTDADLALPDPTISREHAVVHIVDGEVIIEDHKSTNGIFVNGEQVKRSVLREGDFATIGSYTVVMRVLRDSEEDVPAGDTVCIGLDTAQRLHEEFLEKRGAEYLPTLYEVALLFRERCRVEDLLRRILSILVTTLRAERGVVVIQREHEERPVSVIGVPSGVDDDALPYSKTLADYVLRTRTSLLTEDAQKDPRFRAADSVRKRAIGAAMCAPMYGHDKPVGVILVEASVERAGFEKQDLEFLTIIGHVVGVAVENRLLEETRIRQDRLATLGKAVAGISHDMRNLLTSIKVAVGLMEKQTDTADTDGLAHVRTVIRRASEQLETYLSDLLGFCQDQEPVRELVHLPDVVADVLDMVQPRATEHGVELVLDRTPVVPVNADGKQIHRVVVNLVQNAVDACLEQGGTVTVRIEPLGDKVALHVTDTGVGIEPQHIDRLWEPFFTTKGGASTGLGLAICHRIVERHGGILSVDSTPHQGTRFTVFLPAFATVRIDVPEDPRP